MKLTDRRLYQARSLQDLLFRLDFRDDDNPRRRVMAIREGAGLARARQEGATIIIGGGSFVSPDKTKIWGVDISGRWDGRVNFAPTVHAGAKFVIGKAVDGTVPTRYFAENNQRAIEAGLMNGAYGWLYRDRNVSCRSQAQAYYNIIRDARLKLPPVIDFEWTRYAGQQADPDYNDLDKWATEFNRVSGTRSILYSAAGYMNKFGRMPAALRAKFAGFWFASYGGTKPLLPMGFTQDDCDIWQFSASGDAQLLCPGDLGKRELDLNYMTQGFYERYGGATEPPTEPEPGETMETWKITWDNGASLRTGAGIAFPATGALPDNSIVQVVQIVTKTAGVEAWAQVEDGRWFATVYNSQVRAERVTVTPPPAITLKHTIEVYSDGSLKVDGNVIA